MATAKSTITKLTNRLKKVGFEIKRFHAYQHSTAFVKKNGKYVYISADDDRRMIMYRTAESDTDYTGGQNHFVHVDPDRNNFSEAIVKIDRMVSTD